VPSRSGGSVPSRKRKNESSDSPASAQKLSTMATVYHRLSRAGLQEAELHRRRDARLCLACGSADHKVVDCASDMAKRAKIGQFWSAN